LKETEFKQNILNAEQLKTKNTGGGAVVAEVEVAGGLQQWHWYFRRQWEGEWLEKKRKVRH